MSEPAPLQFDVRAAMRRGIASSGALLLLVVLLLVALSRTDVGGEAVRDIRTRARLLPLAAAVVIQSFAYMFMALRWRSLFPSGHRPPPIGLTIVLCAGLLLNYALPGPVGEVGAAWFADRRYGVPFSRALAAGVGGRVVGLATTSIAAGLLWVFADMPVPPEYGRLVAVCAAVIGAGGLTLVVLALRPGWIKTIAAHTVGRLAGSGRVGRLAARAETGVGAMADALHEVGGRGPGPWLRASGWALCGHMSVIAGTVVGAWSLQADPSLAGVAFTYAMSTAAVVAVFAMPGFQVAWDALFVTLLVATANIALPDALVLGALIRLEQFGLVVLGAVALAWLMASDRPPVEKLPATE